MPATKKPSKSTFALPLLVCVALMVAMVGGAKYRETATGVGYWPGLPAGSSRWGPWWAAPEFAAPAGLSGITLRARRSAAAGGLLTALVLFVVPCLVGDGAAKLALNNGADAFAAAVTATAVPFAAVVRGYRAA
ncbi:hypothetical protein AHiyo4_42230 [Arthrobacter sp. Hiyo4]|nr:hypothetical protein AHiyo4_42230 [Arthrobacter sp. Hiyo4]